MLSKFYSPFLTTPPPRHYYLCQFDLIIRFEISFFGFVNIFADIEAFVISALQGNQPNLSVAQVTHYEWRALLLVLHYFSPDEILRNIQNGLFPLFKNKKKALHPFILKWRHWFSFKNADSRKLFMIPAITTSNNSLAFCIDAGFSVNSS